MQASPAQELHDDIAEPLEAKPQTGLFPPEENEQATAENESECHDSEQQLPPQQVGIESRLVMQSDEPETNATSSTDANDRDNKTAQGPPSCDKRAADVAPLPTPMVSLVPGEKYYSEGDGTKVPLRGAGYAKHGKKVKSEASFYSFLGMDMVQSPKVATHLEINISALTSAVPWALK